MKFFRVLLLGVSAFLGVASTSSATSISYEYLTVATDGGPGAGILYTLTVDTVTKAAIFTIDGSSAATDVWRADWFTFKWGTANYQLTNLVAPSGTWNIADYDTNANVKVLNGNTYTTLLESYRSGFYLTSIAQGGGGNPTAPGSICLAPGSGSYSCTVALPKTFTFNIGLPTTWNEDEIAFKVGYYDGVTGNKKNVQFVTGKLSQVLEQVPDSGSTAGLLGVGLLALDLLRRRVGATGASRR